MTEKNPSTISTLSVICIILSVLSVISFVMLYHPLLSTLFSKPDRKTYFLVFFTLIAFPSFILSIILLYFSYIKKCDKILPVSSFITNLIAAFIIYFNIEYIIALVGGGSSIAPFIYTIF